MDVGEYIVKMDDTAKIVGYGQQLIRCKDCRYSRKTVIPYLQNEEKWCYRLEKNRPFDWFCADGKRQ